MKEFDYIIIGGGCAGLSLAYELEIHKKLDSKTLAIIEPRQEYKKDKTWSFWKVAPHNFEDCVKKSWKNFSINLSTKTKHITCDDHPYQSVDSGLFYEKVINKLKKNKNINFFKSKDSVHFFYTLPYAKNKLLVETTWLSNMSDISQKNYDVQIKDYVEKKLNIKNYKVIYKEKGAIPLFYPTNNKNLNKINIGTAGGMTRLSTGYTFLNIQEHSRYIRKNIENIANLKLFEIKKKYQFMDKIFLRVLKKHPLKMPDIFFRIFNSSPKTAVKFLSNKSNFLEDLSIILRMPKWIFVKSLFN